MIRGTCKRPRALRDHAREAHPDDQESEHAVDPIPSQKVVDLDKALEQLVDLQKSTESGFGTRRS